MMNTLLDLLDPGQTVWQIKRKIQLSCRFLQHRHKIVVQGKDTAGWIVMTPLEIWLMGGMPGQKHEIALLPQKFGLCLQTLFVGLMRTTVSKN